MPLPLPPPENSRRIVGVARFEQAVVRVNQGLVVALMASMAVLVFLNVSGLRSQRQPGTTLGRDKTVASMAPVCVGGIIVRPGDLRVGDVDGVVVVPHARAEEVLSMAQDIDARELEQARLIIAERSLRKGLAKYGRI